MSASKKRDSLRWPPGMRHTAARDHWHRVIAAAPGGLSIRDLAAFLGKAYPTVSVWAKFFRYPFKEVPRGRRSTVDWSNVDWKQKNSDLARQLGVSGERVRQMRAKLRLPPAPRVSEGGMTFRRFVQQNSARLDHWSIRQMISISRARISTATAHVILQQFKNGNGRLLPGAAPRTKPKNNRRKT